MIHVVEDNLRRRNHGCMLDRIESRGRMHQRSSEGDDVDAYEHGEIGLVRCLF